MNTTDTIQTDLFSKCQQINPLTSSKEIFNYYVEPVFTDLTMEGAYVGFQGKKMLTWSINDYFGLRNDPRIKAAGVQAAEKWGLGNPPGARALTGNTPEHMQLEQQIAEHYQREAAYISVIGYLGVMSAITALINRGDTVIMDRHSHSCIIDGAMIAQAKSGQRIRFYNHNDMEDLEHHLKQVSKDRKGGILIITEGVFGMHGSIGKLDEIVALKNKYQARLMLDDAHGTGVMGHDGLGTAEHFNLHQDIDVYFTSFSKIFCGIGCFILADKPIIDYIRVNGRQTLMARGLPIAIVGQMLKTLEIIKAETHERRARVWLMAERLQEGLRDMGFDLGITESPLTPIQLSGDMLKLKDILTTLREQHNIYISGICAPAIPPNKLILRLVPTANHTEQDVDHTIAAFDAMKDLFIK